MGCKIRWCELSASETHRNRKGFLGQIAAFASVSVATTIIDFALFNVLIATDALSPLVANTISYSAGIVASYILNKRITFSGGGRANRGHEVGLFLLFNLAGLAINNGAVALVTTRSAPVINAVKLLAGALTWVVKFVTFKHWVYPHSRAIADPVEEPG